MKDFVPTDPVCSILPCLKGLIVPCTLPSDADVGGGIGVKDKLVDLVGVPWISLSKVAVPFDGLSLLLFSGFVT